MNKWIKVAMAIWVGGIFSGFNWNTLLAKKAAAPETKETAPAPEAPSSLNYRTFSSPDHGFSMKYPSNWFEGKRASPAIAFLYLANIQNNPVSNINVQVIPVTLQDPSQADEAVNLVAQQLIDQITSSEGSKIKNDEWIDAGGKRGRELVFEYPYNGKNLRQRQFITYNAGNVFAVIYTADVAVYEEFLPPYQTALESLRFAEK